MVIIGEVGLGKTTISQHILKILEEDFSSEQKYFGRL
jgi:ABC-type glutathione transport system ATPase component